MNTKFIASTLIVLAAATSSAAFASEYNNYNPRTEPVATTQLSRATVQADYLQAVKQGTLPVVGDAAEAVVKTTDSSVSRADVKAQAVQWVRSNSAVSFELM